MKVYKSLGILAATSALVATLPACATPYEAEPPSTTHPNASSQALPPLIITPLELDGNIIEIPLEQLLVLSVPDQPDKWTATISNPTIADFVAGKVNNTASFNPSFEPKHTGETPVTVMAPDEQEYNFTLRVLS